MDGIADGRALKFFIRMMRQGRCAEAFEAAERVLDSPSLHGLRSLGQFSPPRKAAASLRTLLRGGQRRWANFYLARLEGSAEAAEKARSGTPARYAWMAYWLALSRMNAGDLSGARATLLWARKQKTVDWWPYALSAELSLCAGDAAAARREARRGRAAAAADHGNFLAWEGFFHLWRGSYGQARKTFLEAEARGAWEAKRGLGACEVLAGRPGRAIKLLREAQAKEFPPEEETRIWLAEAERLRGRPRAALRILKGRQGFWAGVNRALAWKALRKRGEFERERAALTEGMLRRLQGRAALLSDVPRLANGFRRDMYNQQIWLPPASC
jgi:hypothetical protein